MRQCEIACDRRIEMHDQNTDKRHGADQVQIKKALLFDGSSPLLLLQFVLDEPPQMLGHSGRPSGIGLVHI